MKRVDVRDLVHTCDRKKRRLSVAAGGSKMGNLVGGLNHLYKRRLVPPRKKKSFGIYRHCYHSLFLHPCFFASLYALPRSACLLCTEYICIITSPRRRKRARFVYLIDMGYGR